MKVNRGIFREYDIRGIAGTDIDEKFAYCLGKAASIFLNTKKIIVGWDNRTTSFAYKEALIKGLTESGVDVVDIGMVPSPVMYYALRHLKIPDGIMVTASHNPSEYNGFKIAQHEHCIFGKNIQVIADLMEKEEYTEKDRKGTVEEQEVVSAYVEEIASKVRLDKPIKIVVDAGNGSAGPTAKKLLKEMGVDVVPLFMEPDGTFPNHHPDPTQPGEYKVLIDTVMKEKAAVGIAYDGDGDRLGIIDEKGEMRWGDEIMVLLSREVLENHEGAKICIEVKCSQGLVEDVEAHGGVPIMCATGHSLIEAKMIETGALLTGEMSGHIYFADEWYGFDDAIYSSARLLRILSRSDKSVSEMLLSAPQYFSTPEIRVEVPDEKKFEIVENIKKYFCDNYKVIDIDGVRFLTESGWGLVRASNTQPTLVVRAEGKTEEELEKIKGLLREQLKEKGVEAGF